MILFMIPLYLYLNLTIKHFENKIINSSLKNTKYYDVILLVFIIIIYNKIILYLNENSFIYFLIFYFLFHKIIVLNLRYVILGILFYFDIKNFYSHKLFIYKKLGLKVFIRVGFLEFKIKKIYIILSPFLIYYFNCDIYNYIDIIIFCSFKTSDFNSIFDELLLNENRFFGDEIVLTLRGKKKIEEYQCYLISNILNSSSRLEIEKFCWGKDFFYVDKNFNELMKVELNIKC